ncbi:ATP-binding cassette sub-family A member 1-like [Ostrinia furnacalis]|uniref:ATP-binding cassette sub-family A member 1-like n=1 Tax=Ostrinia furnacalis TaxID=93504 RepID=UPI00103CE028|nr:ATP-binding cassette sub-family A member 1-like [Ostrinia furnacalis]
MNRKRGSGRAAGSWMKFRLLMWKNFLQQWRHPIQTIVEVLLPVITMSLVLLLRWQIEPTAEDAINFSPLPAQSLNNSIQIFAGLNVTNLSIAYSPRSEALEDVLRSSMANLLLNNAFDLIRIITDLWPAEPPFPLPANITWPETPPVTLPPDLDWPDLEGVNKTLIYEFLRTLIRVQPYNSSVDLRTIYAYEERTKQVIAAVEFDDSLFGATDLPGSISYSLRFPERPRLNALFGRGGRSWRTDELFPAFELPGPRSRSSDGGSNPGYVREMFIALQQVISTQLITRITGEPMESFSVNIQRYPHPAYVDDMAVEALQFLFPMFIMLTFSYTAVNITRAITVEKELQLKETLKIMGLPTWIHWTAWFCKQFLFLLVAAVLIMILLKVNWFTNEDGFSDYAVFTNTPWSVLLFYLTLYLACVILFCFMLSGIFSKGSTAALFAGVVWFLTYVPAFILSIDIAMSVPMQIFTCLSINSAMSYGFQLLLGRESTGGMQWGEFMSAPVTETDRLLFGHVVIMLVVDSVLYMLIALYLEQVLPGPYGTPRPWYFLFQKQFWGCGTKSASDSVLLNVPETPDVIKENDPVGHPVGVKMNNLTKVFGKNTAVNNLSLNIYDDQITVLLGHNGAGKSTTISMLTGNLEATYGTVWVAGYDMTWNTSDARSHIGLCPQHNVLFNELTVREHLEFFARLKGFQGEELNNEIDTLIEKLELTEKRDYQSKGLSGGQKRRLCVGVALCGDARVVLLDEPTSGMDPSSRRALWDLLQKEKKGRSMILTTHFMDEADILGDRIAIMASGQLQCVGSPYFLKRHYGVGYSLVIVKDVDFQLEACTEILSKYIPGTTVKEDRGTEVTYNLTNGRSQIFETMLLDLETNMQRIKFKNYGLVATTLEDVFMSVGSDVSSTQSESDEVETATESSYYDFDSSSMDNLTQELSISGFRLLVQHVLAVWLKLSLVWIRSWGLILLQILVPVLQMTATLGVMEYIFSLIPTIQRRALSFAVGYSQTESLLSFIGNSTSSLGALATAAYEMMINSSVVDTMSITMVNEPIDEYYMERAEQGGVGPLRHTVLSGATFTDDSVTAWFSNFGYHDIATSLAAVHTALIKVKNASYEINVFNHPLEVNYADQSDLQMRVTMLAMQLASGIGSSLGIASAVFVMFYIKERVSRAKLLQKAAGIQPAVLWGSAAVFDWLWFLVVCVTIVIICAAFDVMGLSSVDELGRLYLCLMVYGAAMVPLNYLSSLLFQGPALGFVVIFFINVLFGNMGAQIVDALSSPQLNTAEAARILDYILQFFPLYSLVTSVRLLNQFGMLESSCLQSCGYLQNIMNIPECNMTVMCDLYEECCIPADPYWAWDGGIMRYVTVMLITCLVLWGILMIIEYDVIKKIIRREKKPPQVDESTLDEDVLDEEKHVARIGSDLSQHSLVARGLTKYYGKHLAVNQVSFSVSDSECFGLLGVNGAGKTTTFKMLMGDETVSSGDAFVSGHSVRKNITRVHENIGYCPQFDAVFGELTGRETLLLFSLLRGLSASRADARTHALAHALGFTKHLDKRVNQYSGGNKRKLSTAVALLGRTRLVFVDEPTTGVDPAAKRQVWRAIRGAQRSGRGVVLTSHSMEECEALCSRLTIMVNGRFQCLGTPQHLKNKYSEGFTLTIKMRQEEEQASTSSCIVQRPVDTVKQFVESNFTNPKLMEEYQGLLTYYLPDRSIAWSRMFGIMEQAKRDLQVEDYSISQTTLEQIFLQFTKYQQEAAIQ